MTQSIDLNADLGESFGRWELGDDEAMLELVTSANVACGFHAGDPSVLLRTCEGAASRGVAVGAQVSYRDLAGFGRRFVDVPADELMAEVIYQIGALQGVCTAAGTRVRYVKPHGALYNAVAHHEAQAGAVAAAVARVTPGLPVLGLPGSALFAAASAAGLPVVVEAFADRAYQADGTLVPRSEAGALLSDPDEVSERIVGLLVTGSLTAVDGSEVAIAPQSVCLHGDSPGAVSMARAVRDALTEAGVRIEPFAP